MSTTDTQCRGCRAAEGSSRAVCIRLWGSAARGVALLSAMSLLLGSGLIEKTIGQSAHAFRSAASTSIAPSTRPALQLPAAGPTHGTDTINAHLRNCLATASLSCWEQGLIAATGSVPKWFDAFKRAFEEGMRQAGKCQETARAISEFFKKIGGQPVFIEIRAKQYHYMSLDLPDGTSPGITKNGYHVVVKLGDRIYDAFTGPAGMKASEYMANLHARHGYTEKVLTDL